MKEPYVALLDEVNGIVRGTVQDAFWLTNACQTLQKKEPRPPNSNTVAISQPVGGAISPEELSAVLTAHSDVGMASLPGTSPPLPQLPVGKGVFQLKNHSTVIPQSRLLSLQEQDAAISSVMFYVRRHRRATRREAASEPAWVNKLLRHWKTLRVQSGILYRVKKDLRLNKKLI